MLGSVQSRTRVNVEGLRDRVLFIKRSNRVDKFRVLFRRQAANPYVSINPAFQHLPAESLVHSLDKHGSKSSGEAAFGAARLHPSFIARPGILRLVSLTCRALYSAFKDNEESLVRHVSQIRCHKVFYTMLLPFKSPEVPNPESRGEKRFRQRKRSKTF